METYQKVKMNLFTKELVWTLLFMNIISSFQQIPPVIPSPKPLSVIVLDTTFGSVAPNITCKLFKNISPDNLTENYALIATAVTDAAGKIEELLSVVNYTLGRYRISFGIGDYYYYTHGITSFFPHVQITYDNQDGTAATIPLVISPFGINTYKGSSGVTSNPISTTTTSATTTTTTHTTSAPGLLGNLLNNVINLLG